MELNRLNLKQVTMNKTFKQGQDEIVKLCMYFANNRQAFLAPSVKEAHIRMSLIDPFFEALRWDLRNTARISPQYREVMMTAAYTVALEAEMEKMYSSFQVWETDDKLIEFPMTIRK